ncbi:hypothetical protein BGZ51_009237 [Haplosporangium sp. Z 767]|nr:hypothetical protein BGZ51_009237 [Haplosporangium sp. Z 767]
MKLQEQVHRHEESAKIQDLEMHEIKNALQQARIELRNQKAAKKGKISGLSESILQDNSRLGNWLADLVSGENAQIRGQNEAMQVQMKAMYDMLSTLTRQANTDLSIDKPTQTEDESFH